MIVLLRKRVLQMEFDAPAGGVGETGGERQTRVGRRGVVTEGLDGEGDGDQAEGALLTAHPVRTTVRRITRHPILERRPEELDVAFIAIAQPSANEGVGPGEAGELPDALDIIGAGITEAGPMLVRIGRMPGEDATRPTVRAADLDEVMREDAGVTAGEGVGLRNWSVRRTRRTRLRAAARGESDPDSRSADAARTVAKRPDRSRSRNPSTDASANAIPRARAYARTPSARAGRARKGRGDGGGEGALDEGRRARGQEGGTKGSAKVQIGAELLCKSAKVR